MPAKKPVKKALSILKRQRQAAKRRTRNAQVRARVRTLVNKVRRAVAAGDAAATKAALLDAERGLAKAASAGILHHRNAARRVSRLAHLVSSKTAGA
ncbi:MAG: 30S ribosomal protein S20 [Deltaproteobacteria bacterium]|nr:30S ribosomal protein S20 [Deltaproteobacteria bacterium]